MQTKHSSLLSTTGLIACAVLASSFVRAADEAKPAADKDVLPSFNDNYITVSGQANLVKGDKAAFQERNWTSKNGFGGVQDFQFAKDLKNDFSATADGHALAGSEDYLAHIKIAKNEFGSFDMGFKRFRTYYDGIGGFFPTNNAWFPLPNQDLHVDRSKFWVEGVIALPNAPVLTLRYSNELRNGAKDTTIQGDTDFTGVPISSNSALNPVSANRKIVASYIDLSERQQTFEAALKHTVGKTELELEVVYNTNDSNNTRWVNRYPGELKPLVAIPATPAIFISPVLANNAVAGFDNQISKPKIITYTGKFETKLDEQIAIFGGVSYQHAAADIGGDREMFLKLNTGVGVLDLLGGFTPGGRPPYSYKTMSGSTTQNVLTANLGTSFKPTKDIYLSLALKGEDQDMHGNNQVTYFNTRVIQATGVTTIIPIDAPNSSKRSERSWTPELNVRYTGIQNLALYGTLDYRYVKGDEVGSSAGVTTVGSGATGTVGPNLVASQDNAKENHGHYKVGANWAVCSAFTLRGEVFYKDHKNSYTGFGASTGGQYVLGYQFVGTKLTAIVKPSPFITVTGRYVGKDGKMDTAVDFAAKYDSMDYKSHDFGTTIDWTPIKQFYMQGNIDVVFDTISTAYPRAGGTANDVIRNADNNHWTASVIAGFVVDKATNAELQYTQYKASNFEPLYSTVAYGASQKDYSVTAGIKRKLTDKLLAELKLGYISSHNDTTGSFTNYSARVAYLSLQQAF
jgi:hypothetical protein